MDFILLFFAFCVVSLWLPQPLPPEFPLSAGCLLTAAALLEGIEKLDFSPGMDFILDCSRLPFSKGLRSSISGLTWTRAMPACSVQVACVFSRPTLTTAAAKT